MWQTIGLLFVTVVFCSMGIEGLIGAINKDFIYPAQDTQTVRYMGKKARFWGIIFFLVFTLTAMVLTGFLAQDLYPLNVVVVYLGVLSLGYLLTIALNKLSEKISFGRKRR